MNALKISLRFGVEQGPTLLRNQSSVKQISANLQPIAVARNYSQISSQKVKIKVVNSWK